MKNGLFSILFMASSLMITGQGLENIYVERIPIRPSVMALDDSLNENTYSYRIFVDMAPDYGLSVVTGTMPNPEVPGFELFIETSTTFYNSQFGVTIGDQMFPQHISLDSTLIYDSYICMGGVTNGRIGVPLSENSDGYIEGQTVATSISPGLDLSPFEYGGSSNRFSVTDGSWIAAVTGGIKGPNPETNMVMIGQVTTDGILKFNLNVQLRDPANAYTFYYVARFDQLLYEDVTRRVLQFSPLSNIYGEGIIHPEVNLTRPSRDTVVEEGSVIRIAGTAMDEDGSVSVVELRQNGIKIAEDNTPPYEFEWTAVLGEYYTALVAIDDDSATAISPQYLIQVVEDLGSEAPTVYIDSPADQSEFTTGEEIPIRAVANDLDGTVDSVEFFVNDSKIGTVLSDPFELEWTAEEGTAAITAKATDNDGLSATSAPVNILVSTRDNSPPEVNIISPADQSSFIAGEIVSISAEAADTDGSVMKVEFFINDVLKETDSDSPYTYDWTSIAGTTAIKAVATDDDGAVSEPSVVNVDISTGLNDHQVSEMVRFYPSPAGNLLHIDIHANGESIHNLQVMDLSGRVRLRKQIAAPYTHYSGEMDVSSLDPGIYYLVVSYGSSVHTSCFIKR